MCDHTNELVVPCPDCGFIVPIDGEKRTCFTCNKGLRPPQFPLISYCITVERWNSVTKMNDRIWYFFCSVECMKKFLNSEKVLKDP